ncbi:hypothetical protein RUM43_008885 [Polyplax serrata]|uniref:Uncharacterized protein n=1 Tax=Polyplax serrata TaxID=468196 RepID=A0AAN8PH09_POLSC
MLPESFREKARKTTHGSLGLGPWDMGHGTWHGTDCNSSITVRGHAAFKRRNFPFLFSPLQPLPVRCQGDLGDLTPKEREIERQILCTDKNSPLSISFGKGANK